MWSRALLQGAVRTARAGAEEGTLLGNEQRTDSATTIRYSSQKCVTSSHLDQED
jgi:hypothetical protein